MDWKKALKMVVGIPETAKGAAALGSIPAGTEKTVELPAGTYRVSSTPAPPDRNEPRILLAPK